MLKKLASYLGEYRKYAVLTPLLVILEVACELSLPRFMAAIVDVGIASGDLPYILKMGGVMLVLALCTGVFLFGSPEPVGLTSRVLLAQSLTGRLLAGLFGM